MAGLPVTGVSELALEVADLERAAAFYRDALGLPIVERWRGRNAVWVMAGDRTRIGLWTPQVGVAGGRGGEHVHFAMHVAEEDYPAAVGRLQARGLEVEERVFEGPPESRAAYVTDPDGHVVELWTREMSDYAR